VQVVATETAKDLNIHKTGGENYKEKNYEAVDQC
jgi:hypothetical protein